MLFAGVKLLVTNWRLTLVQIVPAMWIWLAMLDIKIHTLHGKGFHLLTGPVLVPAIVGVTVLTAASFYLNGVFAFAISVPGKPQIRPAFAKANRHIRTILSWGVGDRAGALVLRADLDALGQVVLRHQPEHRRRDHDAVLSRRPGADGRHRHQDGALAARQVGRHGGGRGRRAPSSARRRTPSVASAS